MILNKCPSKPKNVLIQLKSVSQKKITCISKPTSQHYSTYMSLTVDQNKVCSLGLPPPRNKCSLFFGEEHKQ